MPTIPVSMTSAPSRLASTLFVSCSLSLHHSLSSTLLRRRLHLLRRRLHLRPHPQSHLRHRRRPVPVLEHPLYCSLCSSTSSPALNNGDDDHFMRLALCEARKAFSLGEVPIGAVIVDSNRSVVSRAHNSVETLHDCTRHAEMVCLQHAMADLGRWRLTDCTLYCTLEPCAMCLSAVTLARVARVVYGADDRRLGACGSWIDLTKETHPFHTLMTITGGVLAEESSALLKSFFRMRREENKIKKKDSNNEEGT